MVVVYLTRYRPKDRKISPLRMSLSLFVNQSCKQTISKMINRRSNLINKLEQIDLNNACRICITGTNFLRQIRNSKILIMIKACTKIELNDNDGLPEKICLICLRTLTKLYNFKKTSERNDQMLRDYLNTSIEKKQKNVLNLCVEDVSTGYNDIQKETEYLPPLVPIIPNKNNHFTQDLSHSLLNHTPPPLVPIKSDFKCEICNKICNGALELQKHKINCCKSKQLQCNVCLKKFTESKRLISHLKGHTVIKEYACKMCDKKYANYSSLLIHMRSHTGERPFKCHICGKGFVRWSGVRIHMKTHEDNRPYVCEICSKAFKLAYHLERHKRTHFQIEPYTCSYCKKSYSQLENLHMHIRSQHTNERPFLCNICGKSFVNSSRLNRHLWIHSETKRYKCKLCPKGYVNKIDLQNHESCHLGKNSNELKNYTCAKCNKKFFHPCRLARHQKVHEKEKSRCVVCYKLVLKLDYKKHLNMVHGFDEYDDDHFVIVPILNT